MMMKSIPVAEAVGMVLGHDVTKIIPRKCKGPAFKRGHIIQENEIGELFDTKVHDVDLNNHKILIDHNKGRGCDQDWISHYPLLPGIEHITTFWNV